MTDEAALTSAINDRPDDDLPRLVYADWCDENGKSSYAEFIRLQCQLSQIEANPPKGPQSGGGGFREGQLMRRIEELWGSWPDEDDDRTHIMGKFPYPEWFVLPHHLHPLTDGSTPNRGECRRGFVDALRCSPDAWFRNATRLCQTQTIRTVTLTEPPLLSRTETRYDTLTSFHVTPHGRRSLCVDTPNKIIEDFLAIGGNTVVDLATSEIRQLLKMYWPKIKITVESSNVGRRLRTEDLEVFRR